MHSNRHPMDLQCIPPKTIRISSTATFRFFADTGDRWLAQASCLEVACDCNSLLSQGFGGIGWFLGKNRDGVGGRNPDCSVESKPAQRSVRSNSYETSQRPSCFSPRHVRRVLPLGLRRHGRPPRTQQSGPWGLGSLCRDGLCAASVHGTPESLAN